MKIAAGAADRFASRPDADVAAVLVYGRDRGLARERAATLLKSWGIDPSDPFSVTELGEDEIKSDVARLADELRAMTLTGGARAVRVRAGGDATAATMKAVLNEIDSGALDP
ncbi:MAG: DNA polymerase III subunit delta, partial [Maricaulaceae bacterium]